MPIYEYGCSGCGTTLTEKRTVEDRDAPLDCADCGSVFTRAIALPYTWGPTRGLS